MPRSKKKRTIVIFFTGGTITMKPLAKNRGVVPSEAFRKYFSDLSPHIRDVALKPIWWSNLPSPHMTPELMFRLAKEIDAAVSDPEVLGAVVIHGTDVLVESAYMADLTVSAYKPVVFTGSMRFYSETGFDGTRNLLNAVKACMLPLPPETGVVLLMTDRIFSARTVIKVNALNIDAFDAPESGPVAYVAGDSILLTGRPFGKMTPRRPIVPTDSINPNVAILSCYTGMDGDLVDHLREKKTAGLVVEGFGAGNVPPKIVPSLEACIREKIPVVLTT
ncbi:MAG: asparaginase, partial [Thermodesulfobacteriota bacterium]